MASLPSRNVNNTFVLPGITLALAVIAIIISALALTQQIHAKNTSGGHVLNGIFNLNGFDSTVSNHAMSISTTTQSGLLAAHSGGSIAIAMGAEVTKATLTGFAADPTGIITSEDTILQALQKVVVLKQTPLTGFATLLGSIAPQDTLLTALGKLQRQQTRSQSYVMSVQPLFPVSSGGLWSSALQGSKTLPANFFSIGTQLTVTNQGVLFVIDQGTMALTLSFGVFTNRTLTWNNISTPGSYTWVMENRFIMMDATHVLCIDTLSMYGQTVLGNPTLFTMSQHATIVFIPSSAIFMDLNGTFTGGDGLISPYACTASVSQSIF